MASAGEVAVAFFWRVRGDDMRELAVLGMIVACSLFIAVGWTDRAPKTGIFGGDIKGTGAYNGYVGTLHRRHIS